jgi:hypothetical protein
MTPVGLKVDLDPIPPILQHTQMFAAGAISFGVEYRVLTEELVQANYGAERSQALHESLDSNASQRIDDSGVCIHVFGDDGREYLRFDCFADGPHYHYVLPDESYQRVVMFDTVANGDPLTWTMSCLRQRLPAMLREAGGARSAERVDPGLVGDTLEQVERAARSIARG